MGTSKLRKAAAISPSTTTADTEGADKSAGRRQNTIQYVSINMSMLLNSPVNALGSAGSTKHAGWH
jgi:hypothetical protein